MQDLEEIGKEETTALENPKSKRRNKVRHLEGSEDEDNETNFEDEDYDDIVCIITI